MSASSPILLFQGDSITDAKRSREVNDSHRPPALGMGYANQVAGRLLCEEPSTNWRFFNRGISGNRIVDLYARILDDTINLQPDILSVLIGVNDTWHHFQHQNGVSVPKYERLYRDFLTEVKAARPGIRFILGEPFTLPTGHVTSEWEADIRARQEVVANLAETFGATFIPYQEVFNQALEKAPPEYWAYDGVHPTVAGHYLMAESWLRAFRQN